MSRARTAIRIGYVAIRAHADGRWGFKCSLCSRWGYPRTPLHSKVEAVARAEEHIAGEWHQKVVSANAVRMAQELALNAELEGARRRPIESLMQSPPDLRTHADGVGRE